jgi:hypothetical protein
MIVDDLVDEKATALARQVFEQDLDEPNVKWQIAALVPQSTVPMRVAFRDARFYGQQAQEDYAEYLREKLTFLIASKTCDLELLAEGASLSGWMYAICSSAISRASVREVVQPHNKRSHRAEQNLIEMVGFNMNFVEDTHSDDDEWLNAWEDEFVRQSPSARLRNEQIHLRAKVLIGAYHLEPPLRGVYLTNRDELLTSLDDPKRASADTIRSLETGKTEGIAVLWPSQLEAFSELFTIITHALALAALTPVSPPTAMDLRALRDELHLPKHKAGRIVKAFARHYSETYHSEYSHKTLEPKSLTDRENDWVEFEQEVTGLGDAHLFYEKLCDKLSLIERSRFSSE